MIHLIEYLLLIMPVVLDRLPLPNLTLYSCFSLFLVGCSVYFSAIHVTSNPSWRDDYYTNTNRKYDVDVSQNVCVHPFIALKDGFPYGRSPREDFFTKFEFMKNTILYFHLSNSSHFVYEMISFMLSEPLCIWTLINMAYCFLILLGTAIQRLVFGELRVSEQEHIKDKFWNFVFYKFIFVFGVMNVQLLGEVILWCSWLSVLGFLHLLALLCRDRFEYLSFSPSTSKRTHVRLLGLLGIIFFVANSCLFISFFVGMRSSMNTFAFMAAECILLNVRTLYVICRYCIYLWDISHDGLWEKRGQYIYTTELIFELSDLIIDMVHHIHMLVWSNMLLTMASLVICMQIRLLFYQIQHKIKSHRNYVRVVRLISRYPEITVSNKEDSMCAICWEQVEIGRKLSCTHIFHSSCLQAWLHHDLSCPTCRHKLKQVDEVEEPQGMLSQFLQNQLEENDSSSSGSQFPSPGSANGSEGRYVSWLSSFSVEQSHTQLPRQHQRETSSQLDNMAREVVEMFPDMSYAAILEDLQRTRSLYDTVENILEKRLSSPPPMFSDNEKHHRKDTNTSWDVSKMQCKQIELSSTDSDSESDTYENSGSRFSKSPHEREIILEQRKMAMYNRARGKFLFKESIRENGV